MTAKEAKIRALKRHVESLKDKHRSLDHEVAQANSSYAADPSLKEMKVKKLQLKQEISWIEREIKGLEETVDKN